MTTVAYRAGVIAADRQCDGWMQVNKLFRLKDGSVLSGAGYFDDLAEVASWLASGAKEANKPVLPDGPDDNGDFLLVLPNGKAYWLTSPWLRRVEIVDEFVAFGSGANVALGAMAAGASARRAVEIACRFDESTGKGVTVMRVKKS